MSNFKKTPVSKSCIMQLSIKIMTAESEWFGTTYYKNIITINKVDTFWNKEFELIQNSLLKNTNGFMQFFFSNI